VGYPKSTDLRECYGFISKNKYTFTAFQAALQGRDYFAVDGFRGLPIVENVELARRTKEEKESYRKGDT